MGVNLFQAETVCHIDRDFNVGDYSNVTLSGPFVNPEDIMNMG